MFADVVTLYRLLGKPDFPGNSFEAEVLWTQDIHDLGTRCAQLDEKHGVIRYDHRGSVASFEVELPENDFFCFYESVDKFILGTQELLEGKFRDGIYIRELDYSSTDIGVPLLIVNLKRNIEFIRALRSFASINVDVGEALQINKLIFLRPSDGRSFHPTVVAPIVVDKSFCEFEVGNFTILEILARKSEKIHIEERRLILSSAIADVLSEAPDRASSLVFLARHWKQVTRRYYNDLQAYVNGFAFDALRKKIADAAVEGSSKIGSAVSELISKIIAVPVSLAALAAIASLDNEIGFVIGFLGILVACLLCLFMVIHHAEQATHLIKVNAFNFEGYHKKIASFPRMIRDELLRINKKHRRDQIKVNFLVFFFAGLSVTPVAIAVAIGYWKFFDIFVFKYSLYRYCY